jgi:chaperone modulatory protein CbpM
VSEDLSRALEGSLFGDDEQEVALGELCDLCAVHAEIIEAMVDEGILRPRGRRPEWRFSTRSAWRVRTVLRLQRDLRVNLPGAALALDLLEQIETLRSRLQARGDVPGE